MLSSKLPVKLLKYASKCLGFFRQMGSSDWILMRVLRIQNWSPGRKEKISASEDAGAASGQARPPGFLPGKPQG